jgi:hypothetical protein
MGGLRYKSTRYDMDGPHILAEADQTGREDNCNSEGLMLRIIKVVGGEQIVLPAFRFCAFSWCPKYSARDT